LGSLRHAYFGSLFLGPKYVKGLRLGQAVSAVNEQGCHDLAVDYGAQRDRLGASGTKRLEPNYYLHLPCKLMGDGKEDEGG